MEFQRERVYTALNADELHEGDKVITAKQLGNLKYQVSQKDYYVWTIKEIKEDTYSDRFVTGNGAFPLVYLIERAENCTNCVKCKDCVLPTFDLEVIKRYNCKFYERAAPKTNSNCTNCKAKGKWEVCKYEPVSCQFYEAEPHYRPFANTDELIKVWREKSKQVHSDYSLTMPYIWIRQKECSKGGLLITYFGEDEVKTDAGFLTMSKLLNAYTFTDGSVCGVEE